MIRIGVKSEKARAISFASMLNKKLSFWADVIMVGQISALANSSFHSLSTNDRAEAPLLIVSQTDGSNAIASGRNAFANDQYHACISARCITTNQRFVH